MGYNHADVRQRDAGGEAGEDQTRLRHGLHVPETERLCRDRRLPARQRPGTLQCGNRP